MASAEMAHGAARRVFSSFRQSSRCLNRTSRRGLSTTQARAAPEGTQAQRDLSELEPESGITTSHSSFPDFDPVKQTLSRKTQLPASRYQFRPPKYYRGPLHPHQPPAPSDPASREFIPGPFSLARSEQTYDSTVAPDLMTLAYHHYPPGYTAPTKGARLRSWDDSSPYHKNRPTRGPRGGDTLRPLKKPVTFRNIPRLEKITVHSFVREATTGGSAPLHVAGMALQAITGVRATPHEARTQVVNWNLRKGKNVAVTCELKGEYMYHFLGKLVDVVMPRIKDYQGISSSSGDGVGNYNLGFTPDEVAYFPEIEVNYDFYPPKMIPGCHVNIKTSARTDTDGKLLLASLGIPFDL